MRRFAAGLVSCLVALAAGAAAAQESVALVLSEPGGAYAEVGEAIRRRLPPGAAALHDTEGAVRARPRVAAAVGTQACASLAESALTAPLLCVLIPRARFEGIAASAAARGRTIGALPIEQPLARQLALIRTAFPERRRVGALLGPEAATQAAPLAAAAGRQGLNLLAARISAPEEISPALQRVLGDAEVLLAVPDSMVFNAASVQNILRASFQSRVPLVGFSPAYARAGAVLALYSTPAQIGEQAGQTLGEFLAGKPLPRLQAPRLFEVAINRHVARSLGLALEDEKALAERLRRQEESP